MLNKMNNLKIIGTFLLLFSVLSCGQRSSEESGRYGSVRNSEDTTSHITERYKYFIDTPVCNENGCTGVYKGVEFVDEEYMVKLNLTGTDIAHNYSNVMCKYVGNKLKELYNQGLYSKVDLKRIRMSTKGMGDGDRYVEYRVIIPFVRVKTKGQAMTAFDHSGGWGHKPDIEERKRQLLKGGIVKGKRLYVSPLKKTPEGLQEYWIQWRHSKY
jgi:hypothetical protein